MNIDHFMTRFSSVLMNEQDDALFSNLKFLTGGVSSHRTAKLLNFATSCLAEDECYLEVGVFTGYTMIAASYLNNRVCVGIDSFMPDQIFSLDREAVKDRCMKNLRALTINCTIIESDFRTVTPEQVGRSVGVHFIDGDHNYGAVMEGMEWVTPMLSKESVIVFDDFCYPEIRKAVMEIGQRPGHELIFMNRPLYVGSSVYPIGDKVFQTGVAVMRVTQ